jgi:cytochrome c peroxidase
MNAFSRARILLIEDEAKTARAVLNLGQQLFFDPRLTVDSNMSCASCHQPALYGTDALPTAWNNIHARCCTLRGPRHELRGGLF